MQQNDFEQLKDFVLQKNPYFNFGFTNAVSEKGTVYMQCNNERRALLPADDLSNYFYLRQDALIKHEAQYPSRATDNHTQRLSFLDAAIVYLVAIVKDADALALVDNLRNTAMMFELMNAQPLSSAFNREKIIAEELTGAKANDVSAVLQRLKSETVVKLTLQVSKIFIPSECIVNPCKNLSL